MKSWSKTVSENILPLSISNTLPDAFQEWYFNENTIDYEEPIEKCNLCDHEEVRYHFEIENKHNHNTLLVGSQCILRFKLKVYDDGKLLDENGSKRKLNKLIEQMRIKACIKSLEKVAEKEQSDILNNALEYYKKNKCLTPKFAFVVFWRLNANKIDFQDSFFKITLSNQKLKEDLRNMEHNRVLLIWKALSSLQRKIAENMGHKKPDNNA